MKSLICFEVRDGVAVIGMNHPPVNALTTGLPQGIAEAVERAQTDPAIHSIIVMGAGRTFAAGADIKEFVRFVAGQGPMPVFHRWLYLIQDSTKPVVISIHG